MHKPSRHDLVWLKPAGWARLLTRCPAADAGLLAHWAAACLPLVATRHGAAAGTEAFALGLPAPLRWAGRRVALAATLDEVDRIGRFPTLLQAIASLPVPVARRLDAVAAALGARAALTRVYGSHGWQALTGLDCLHAGSDLDLLIPAPSPAEALLVCARLASYHGELRVDGELLLPGGGAVAWREWHEAGPRGLDRVLVKHVDGAELIPLSVLWTDAADVAAGRFDTLVAPAPPAASATAGSRAPSAAAR